MLVWIMLAAKFVEKELIIEVIAELTSCFVDRDGETSSVAEVETSTTDEVSTACTIVLDTSDFM
jgi:H+/gluconate symporter-like permease